jgi:hypothetical protein
VSKPPGAFLAGAGSRLLPASLPFRFFGAAVASHVLAWIALLAGAQEVPRFVGGLGWPLAALHLVTLGVLAMTAIGASLQLLPVATRRPVGHARLIGAIWWSYTAGVAVLVAGMGFAAPRVLAAGAVATIAALGVYAVLLVRNLVGARGMREVVLHGWVACAALVATIVTAYSLAGSYVGAPGLARGVAQPLHVVAGIFGFMGMLALGLSYVLVPMFALAHAPAERPALASGALAAAALALAAMATFIGDPLPLRIAAIAAGVSAVAVHLRLMLAALASGMRRNLGRSFVLVRIAWALLALTLATAAGVALDVPVEGGATLFVTVAVGGWLLTFLLGILQRIVPFLAAMHAGQRKIPGRKLPPTPSSLTADRPLAVHFHCHFAALLLLAAAILADSAWLVRVAATIGAIGAAAFAQFYVAALRRIPQAPIGWRGNLRTSRADVSGDDAAPRQNHPPPRP